MLAIESRIIIFNFFDSVASGRVTVVPDFSNASTNQPMANLKSRADTAKPFGLIRSDANELLVIYDSKSPL